MPTYSPNWAPHVTGSFPERQIDHETGQAEPQRVDMVCSICNATHRVMCNTGAVRQWVLRFAQVHTHKDPFTGAPR